MSESDNCIFCRIVRREIPATVVYETDKVLAFRDISPMAPVHVLIIPKAHYETLTDMPTGEGLYEAMFAAAHDIARMEGVSDTGFRTVINCRDEGGQVVYHLHMHLLGGRKLSGKLG
jgi:histidine triad (HIT) family protein